VGFGREAIRKFVLAFSLTGLKRIWLSGLLLSSVGWNADNNMTWHVRKESMIFLSRIGLVVLLALISPVTAELRAEDWPQWRGPNRDGDWNETGILKSFPAEGLKVCWRTPVGPGWSSPVVARGRVYLTDMRLDKPCRNLMEMSP
jgi:PQQ-like domain